MSFCVSEHTNDTVCTVYMMMLLYTSWESQHVYCASHKNTYDIQQFYVIILEFSNFFFFAFSFSSHKNKVKIREPLKITWIEAETYK